MSSKAKAGLETRANELGFDTAQAYVRYWANGETRQVAVNSTYQDLRRPEVQALRYLEMILMTHENTFESAQQALDYVVREINRLNGLRYLNRLLGYKAE